MRAASRWLGVAATVVLGIFAGADRSVGQPSSRTVDLELVLAVDVSQSMDREEHALQKGGYVEAFRNKDVINALMSGPQGKIAVTYMEWGGDFPVEVLIPWTIIDSEKSAHAFADTLDNEPVNSMERTSISNALFSAADLIERNDIISHRKVIDVSGDGANNAGPPIEQARDAVLKKGIVINGLPIMLNKPMQFYDIPHLDRYYKNCVIGGPAAFIAPVFSLDQLAATIRKKLVLEIAGREVEPGTAPVQFASAATAGVSRVQLKLPTEKTDCFAGEKAIGSRFGFPG
ncbi:MAG TPA: DUF1194 domain-containing protein [Hyphomonadaceae bacterium]|nr:DUF1194 domain-containing protein [Hyphomonadaceae bacterium]